MLNPPLVRAGVVAKVDDGITAPRSEGSVQPASTEKDSPAK